MEDVPNIQNKLLIQYFKVYIPEQEKYELIESKKNMETDFIQSDDIIKYFIFYLLRCSAEQIYLVDFNYPNPYMISAYNSLEKNLKNRIQVIDKQHEIAERIRRYFNPIYQDLDTKNNLSVIYLANIERATYLLTLASKYKSELCFDEVYAIPSFVSHFNKIKLSDESRYRFEVIRGIFNRYKSNSISCLEFIPKSLNVNIYRKIEEHLLDAELIEASKLRGLFGFKKYYKSARLKYNKLIQKIHTYSKYFQMMNIVKDIIVTINKSTLIGIPDIPDFKTFQVEHYSPPIISMNKYKIKLLNNLPFKYVPRSWTFDVGILNDKDRNLDFKGYSVNRTR